MNPADIMQQRHYAPWRVSLARRADPPQDARRLLENIERDLKALRQAVDRAAEKNAASQATQPVSALTNRQSGQVSSSVPAE